VVKKKGTKDRDLVRTRGAYGRAVQRHGEDSEEARRARQELEAERSRLRIAEAKRVLDEERRRVLVAAGLDLPEDAS
jgi:hypothetical protein